MSDTSSSMTPAPWLIRIPKVFEEMEAEIIGELAAERLKKLGSEFLLIRLREPSRIQQSEAAKFLRWNMPVQHMWPCCPKETPGFIEKAAQALWKKFGAQNPQAVLVGALDPHASNRYYRTLASNLRGRTIQLFPPAVSVIRDAEAQDSAAPTLFCLIGEEGLFCGMQTPLASNGFHPGGTKFIRQSGSGVISRAGAKVAEALHHLALYLSAPNAGSHWLELGASPGGMTMELLARSYRVTAVDRAPLDVRLNGASGLYAVCMDAALFRPQDSVLYDAILSDMNGDARDAIMQVARLSRNLRSGGLVIFTLKNHGTMGFAEINQLAAVVREKAAEAGLKRIAMTHLTYNRDEFTLFFQA